MRRVRVRWTSAAKAAAIAVAALGALQTLPPRLKPPPPPLTPPAPPPLAPDVGLPQAVVRDAEPKLHQISAPGGRKFDAVRKRGRRPRPAPPPAPVAPVPEPHSYVPASEPAPAPIAPPAELPPSPPAPPGDGSEE